jgi:hypothetical protein
MGNLSVSLYLNRRSDNSHLWVQTFVCQLVSGLITTQSGFENFNIPALLYRPQTNFGFYSNPRYPHDGGIHNFWYDFTSIIRLRKRGVILWNPIWFVLCESTFNRPLCPYHSPFWGVWLRDFSDFNAIALHQWFRFGLYPVLFLTYRWCYPLEHHPEVYRRFDRWSCFPFTRLPATVHVSINPVTVV